MKFYEVDDENEPGLWLYPICISPLYNNDVSTVYFCFEYKDGEIGTGFWALDLTEATKDISGLEYSMIRGLFIWDYEL